VGTWLTVRDTVAVETLARLATSRMSTSPLFPQRILTFGSIRYPEPLQSEWSRGWVRKVSPFQLGPLMQDIITGRGVKRSTDWFLHFDDLRGKRLLTLGRVLRGYIQKIQEDD